MIDLSRVSGSSVRDFVNIVTNRYVFNLHCMCILLYNISVNDIYIYIYIYIYRCWSYN